MSLPVNHEVSACCKGEVCRVCKEPATHKVEEVIFHDVTQMRHPLTAYLCCEHFIHVMGRDLV